MDAELLRCPSCGAPASAEVPNCSHCGAQLATVACPKCFNRIFRDSKFCPACGAAAVPWSGRQGDLPCPECSRSMLRGEIGSCVLDHCGTCLGVWLDTETFKRICQDADQQTAMLGAPQMLDNLSRPPDPNIRYRKCPRCADVMRRINFARCSGVVVDVCQAHGTWFDHSELHRIIAFVRAGGMERSRAAELEYLADRSAVLLRFSENKSLREVGKTFGPTDDTARIRVKRAIEHLREFGWNSKGQFPRYLASS